MTVPMPGGATPVRGSVLRTSSAFQRYWMGQTVSVFGDQVSRIGVPLIAVATLHASATQMVC